MATVYGSRADGSAPGDRVFAPIERVIYRLLRVNPQREQRWNVYAIALLAFSLISFLAVYVLQRFQDSLVFNPTNMPAVAPLGAFNAAVSFMTNTNWQWYSGEVTMSHLTQMVGLAVQNFVSAAAGMAVVVAIIRGIVRRGRRTLGNFWVDLTRTTLRILLPLSFVVAILLSLGGVVQNFRGLTEATPIDATVAADVTQSIPGGPVASQIAIKQLGTNGGGFFNTNSAHPFENSTPITNFIEMWAILIIPLALVVTYGVLVGSKKQARVLLAVMVGIWLAFSVFAIVAESAGNPNLTALGVDQGASAELVGGNLEGKEVRYGPASCGLWAATTTGTSNGSVNCMHDSFTPIGGMWPMAHMKLGEVSPGGVGVGLMGMLIYALLAVFIAGLMVGRTPEYLGKKIQAPGDEARRAVPDRHAPRLAGVRRGVGGARLGGGDHLQPWRARVVGGALQLRLGIEQQRLGVRRPGHRHRLVHGDPGHRHAGGPLLLDHPGAGHRWFAGAQAAGPRHRRHVPDRLAAVRWTRRRGDHHRRRPHVLPRPRAGPHRRAAVAVEVHELMTTTLTPEPTPVPTPTDRPPKVRRRPPAARSLFDPAIVKRAALDSFVKLDPRTLAKNPVMFVVEVGSVLTTILFIRDFADATGKENLFAGIVVAFLWFTVLFANFAEAMAEGRGKAQAATLRKTRSETVAHVRRNGSLVEVPSSQLQIGDLCVVKAGEVIPGDGDVAEGIATVDESAITGESAPVIRESGGDRSAVTGGTRVLSDEIVVRITAKPGETFLDRMIALVEGADRQKTPNEIALTILLAGLTIIFLLAVVTLQPFAIYSNAEQQIIVLVALLVCLIPTTIGGLLSAIGIAGMDRLVQRNVLAMSGRAVEAAGDVTTLLLDKTGTITYGARQAAELLPVHDVTEQQLAEAALASSLADETPEGRSIVEFAIARFGLTEPRIPGAVMVPFTAQTRMSGMDFPAADGVAGRQVRKGAAETDRADGRGRRWRRPARGAADGRADLTRRRHAARRHRPPRR